MRDAARVIAKDEVPRGVTWRVPSDDEASGIEFDRVAVREHDVDREGYPRRRFGVGENGHREAAGERDHEPDVIDVMVGDRHTFHFRTRRDPPLEVFDQQRLFVGKRGGRLDHEQLLGTEHERVRTGCRWQGRGAQREEDDTVAEFACALQRHRS